MINPTRSSINQTMKIAHFMTHRPRSRVLLNLLDSVRKSSDSFNRIFGYGTRLFLCGILLTLLASEGTAESTEASKPESTYEQISIDGGKLIIRTPAEPAPARPWLWIGEFGGHLKKLEAELLDLGWHVAYLPFSNKFGSPAEIELWEEAYDYLRSKRGLAPRPAMLGISRGGLYVNAWTRKHPDRVSVLYLDNGVCDPRSWPGGFELSMEGRGSPKDWTSYKDIFGFSSDDEALKNSVNPIAGFDEAIQNNILLISVHGTADGTVPYEDNAKRLVDLWKKSGGRVKMFAKEGGRHHPHGLPDLSELIQVLTAESQN